MAKIKKSLYLIIYEKLLESIKNSKKELKMKLPSENELAIKYKANRHTIRKSLQKLENDGLIYTKKGIGRYKTNVDIKYSITDKSSFSSKVTELGYKPKTIILSHNIIKADKQLSEFFNIAPLKDVIELKLLRYADELPIYVTYSYFDAIKFSKISQNLNMQPFSLYKLIHKCYPGIQITKTNSVFQAINSTNEIREYLRLPINVPILKLIATSKDQDNNPVEFGVGYLRGDTCKVGVNLI